MSMPTTSAIGPDQTQDRLRAFALGQVRLLPGPILDRQELNGAYLLSLDVDRLLHVFRLNAGVPTNAEPLGGWESPDCGLRGHFVGHYLSACAQTYAVTRDSRFRDRVEAVMRGLGECQDAIGTGFLSACPESDLDAIETRFEGAWASYYVLQKLLSGLIDAHRHCQHSEALRRAAWLADYIEGRIAKVPPDRLERMLRTDLKPNPTNEFGALSEALQDLFEFTRHPAHLRLAETFDRDWFVGPLKRRQDHLTGLHANTHLAMVLGLVKRFERTRDASIRDAVAFFWERTAIARSYVNGGSSGPRPDGTEKSVGAEHWPAPFKLAGTLTPKINESCVAHGMFKLTDALLRWTGEPRYSDFLERLYFNSVLPVIHPREPGRYLYDHPLSAGSKRKYGNAFDSFWCCYGSSVEAMARLGASIYYRGRDNAGADTLFVNLFVSSELRWPELGLVIRQTTDFLTNDSSELCLHCEEPVTIALQIRTPGWATQGITVEHPDGTTISTSTSPFTTVARRWCHGDRLRITLPQSLRTEAIPDDPTRIAFLRGPLVLAAANGLPLSLRGSNAAEQLSLANLVYCSNAMQAVTTPPPWFTPLSTVSEESYGVYFTVEPD